MTILKKQRSTSRHDCGSTCWCGTRFGSSQCRLERGSGFAGTHRENCCLRIGCEVGVGDQIIFFAALQGQSFAMGHSNWPGQVTQCQPSTSAVGRAWLVNRVSELWCRWCHIEEHSSSELPLVCSSRRSAYRDAHIVLKLI